jgi:hypothetical protein
VQLLISSTGVPPPVKLVGSPDPFPPSVDVAVYTNATALPPMSSKSTMASTAFKEVSKSAIPVVRLAPVQIFMLENTYSTVV